MKRRELIAKQGFGYKRGAPAPCFTPDFTADNRLYKEFDSLNEVSVAQGTSSLKDIVNFRLRPVTLNDGLSASDDVIMDNILPKSLDNNQLLSMAHYYEEEVLNEQNKSD